MELFTYSYCFYDLVIGMAIKEGIRLLKVNQYYDPSLKQNRVDIYYGEKDKEISALFTFLEEKHKMVGTFEGKEKRFSPYDVFYFEAIEKKCFAYLENEVYQVKGNLQSLEEQYACIGFVRINKSMVLNILKIDELKACINMKTQAFLENGEVVIINRSYKKSFAKRLLEFKQGGLAV